MKPNLFPLWCCLFLSATMGWAQIVNTGTVYLGEQTLYSSLYSFTNTDKGAFYNDGQAYFVKDFTNDGTFDFIADRAAVHFTGSQTQNLTGKQEAYFNRLVLDHENAADAFLLKNRFVIEREVHFKRGVIDAHHPNARVHFNENAIANNATNKSHVDGPVFKTGKTDFAYPIGNQGFYQPLLIEGLQQLQEYSSVYRYQNSNFDYPHQQRSSQIARIDNREFWEVSEVNGDQPLKMLSLSFSLSTTPEDYIQAAEEELLIIVYWSSNEEQWENKGGTIDLNNRLITSPITENGVFTLGIIKRSADDCQPEVFNFVDTHGASDNKYLRVESNCAEITKLSAFNRWGIKVFETNNYGLQGDVFDGISSGRLTLNRNQYLPTGTYYYIMEYEFDNGEEVIRTQKNGYVYVKSN